jgi:hypothetical protein
MSTYKIISSNKYSGRLRDAEPDSGPGRLFKRIRNPPDVIKTLYEKHKYDEEKGLLPSIVDIKQFGINFVGYPEDLYYLQTSNGGDDSHIVHLKKVQPPSTFRHKRSPKSLRNTKQKSKGRSKVRSKGRSKQRRSRKM